MNRLRIALVNVALNLRVPYAMKLDNVIYAKFNNFLIIIPMYPEFLRILQEECY